jgi:GT2 family glycosyltransferase
VKLTDGAAQRPVTFSVAILIVSYRCANDVRGCLEALSRANPEPKFEVFIAENGGPDAFDTLANVLTCEGGPCRNDCHPKDSLVCEHARRNRQLRLVRTDGLQGPLVHLAEMSDNLGYGGGVNAWLRPLLRESGWVGVWVLNPDTEPDPDALAELSAYASSRDKGLVGSRLISMSDPDRIITRGLSWRKLRASSVAIDGYSPTSREPDLESIERRLDAPSGASIYASRELIQGVGLMKEHYFLYFEDLEWGLRAKKFRAPGYAHSSVVHHKGGTTIGTARRRRDRSKLSVYLSARNNILFVREHFLLWLPWTVVVGLMQVMSYAVAGAHANMVTYSRGLLAGLVGERGKPGWW